MIAQKCHTISTRVEVSPNKMSNSWDMRKGIGNPQGPNGEYNKPYTDGVNAKRIRTNLWPSGKFNDQEGPLSALQNSDSSMRSMSKNLTTNQTVMTLYINIPRPGWCPIRRPESFLLCTHRFRRCATGCWQEFQSPQHVVGLSGGHKQRRHSWVQAQVFSNQSNRRTRTDLPAILEFYHAKRGNCEYRPECSRARRLQPARAVKNEAQHRSGRSDISRRTRRWLPAIRYL